jgi:hypothetical protein
MDTPVQMSAATPSAFAVLMRLARKKPTDPRTLAAGKLAEAIRYCSHLRGTLPLRR